jgi:hypothetical protein
VHRDLIPLRRRPFCVFFLCLLNPVSERDANIKTRYTMLLSLSGTVLLLATIAASGTRDDDKGSSFLGNAEDNAKEPIDQGRHTFRFDTYGDEAFWTDQLQIQQSIQHLTPSCTCPRPKSGYRGAIAIGCRGNEPRQNDACG